MRKSVALASGNSARRKERSGEKPYKFYGTHVSFHGGLARVCGHTRVSGVLEGVGGQRPIGSKHSLSERVSWTQASRTRRGLGLPLLERSELSFFLFPPFFFPFLFFLFFATVAFYRHTNLPRIRVPCCDDDMYTRVLSKRCRASCNSFIFNF